MTWACCGACDTCKRGNPMGCEKQAPKSHTGARPDGSPIIRGHGHAVTGAFSAQSSFATHAVDPAAGDVTGAPDAIVPPTCQVAVAIGLTPPPSFR